MIQVLCGMIASGKSTYASNAAKLGIICVNDDAIVKMLHADNYILYDKKLKVLYKSIENHIIATSLAMGRSVIVDRGLNINPKGRKRWINLAQSFECPCQAIFFKNDGPQSHAKRRFHADNRGHDLEYWQKVAEFHNSLFVPPSLEEGFDSVFEIQFPEIQQGKVFNV